MQWVEVELGLLEAVIGGREEDHAEVGSPHHLHTLFCRRLARVKVDLIFHYLDVGAGFSLRVHVVVLLGTLRIVVRLHLLVRHISSEPNQRQGRYGSNHRWLAHRG